MTSTFHQISSLILLVLFASQILKVDSRENQFFSKTPSTINKGVVLTDEDDHLQPQQQEEPSFLPQGGNAYGIGTSAMKVRLPESFNSEVKQEDLKESREFDEEQTFSEDSKYYNNEKDANDSFSDEREELSESRFGDPNQVEGIRETPFMDNGYEVENFKGNEKLSEYQVNSDLYNDQQVRNAENFNWP